MKIFNCKESATEMAPYPERETFLTGHQFDNVLIMILQRRLWKFVSLCTKSGSVQHVDLDKRTDSSTFTDHRGS